MADEAAHADPAAVLKLATWLSPAFPVGAFAWSHGLEACIAEGWVRNGTDTEDWIAFLLQAGSGWNDLVLFAAAFRASDNPEELAGIAELASVLAGSSERRLETLSLGQAFAEAVAPWENAAPAAPYPVAVAFTAARSDVPLGPALVAYAHAFAGSLLGAATRLVPLGQREAMRILNGLEPVILRVVNRAKTSTLDDLGSAAIASDIAAMRHETLRTRLFRS